MRRAFCLLGIFLVVACNSVLDIPEAHLKPDVGPSTPPGDDATTDGVVCGDGEKDCNGQPQDGCETDVSSDPSNCGECGHGCAGGLKCLGGTCKCQAKGDCGEKETSLCDAEQGICVCDGEDCQDGVVCTDSGGNNRCAQ